VGAIAGWWGLWITFRRGLRLLGLVKRVARSSARGPRLHGAGKGLPRALAVSDQAADVAAAAADVDDVLSLLVAAGVDSFAESPDEVDVVEVDFDELEDRLSVR
jgi:hypothetical protein